MAQYRIEDDINSVDDDSVVAGVVVVVVVVVNISDAKAGGAKAELLQHAKNICKARITIVHAGASPDQKGVGCRVSYFLNPRPVFDLPRRMDTS
jgi:hypothetical protein